MSELFKNIEVANIELNDLRDKISNIEKYLPATDNLYLVRDEFKSLITSSAAVQKLIDDYQFSSVLDIGAGALNHSQVFAKYGKKVTAVDFGVSVYYQQYVTIDGIKIEKIIGDFNKIEFKEQFDCVWASHILEHQPNVSMFLNKLVSLTKDGGIIAITIPPFKHEIVGGHVSVWNAGMVLYRLILAGVDCSEASILAYGYNISIIVRKKTAILEGIEYDAGDIRRIKQYLPKGIEFNSNKVDDPFNGNIKQLNWY
ncbi:MAG: class I SAM-dependent methyltransferase [Alphaproteobacteria bacterium]|nr:class I SAM-dependent methyltransferase [Alphaproteobacteria bacterium]